MHSVCRKPFLRILAMSYKMLYLKVNAQCKNSLSRCKNDFFLLLAMFSCSITYDTLYTALASLLCLCALGFLADWACPSLTEWSASMSRGKDTRIRFPCFFASVLSDVGAEIYCLSSIFSQVDSAILCDTSDTCSAQAKAVVQELSISNDEWLYIKILWVLAACPAAAFSFNKLGICLS